MDRHAATGNGENHQSNHELLEEIAQLEERERVLIGENDDLRGQLVEMKKEEKKKFDDLMVEHRQLKDNANRSQRDENGGSLVRNAIHIKQEHLEEQSDNEQQMYKDDPDTNAHIVTVNIKTEPMDCDFVVVKEEIKEEDDEGTSTNTNQVTVKTESIDEDVKVEIKEEIKEEVDHDDDCDGCVRCLVKKEEVSDDGEVDHEEGELIRGGEHDNEVDEPSSNQTIDSNEVMNQENGLGDDDEDKSDLGGDDEMRTSANDNHDGSVVVSSEPSTSSTPLNLTKRKQTQSNRTVKRSKKTVEDNDEDDGDDDDDDEDIATDAQTDDKIKVIHFNCSEENCEVKSNSMDQLHGHLLTTHGLFPHRCFAQNCNSRFGNSRQMAVHIKSHHSNATQFVCTVCGKVFASQCQTYDHWHHSHLTGQFECNLNACSQMFATRQKMQDHQRYKHCPESKRFECTHSGCSSSFVLKSDLARHELTHLNTRPFHCTWLECSHSAKQRANLLKHIRMKHFGLPKTVKEQVEKKIEDDRDPNEYVRVVEEGDE